MVVSSLISLTVCTDYEIIETNQTNAIEFVSSFVEHSFADYPNISSRLNTKQIRNLYHPF